MQDGKKSRDQKQERDLARKRTTGESEIDRVPGGIIEVLQGLALEDQLE